MNINVSTQAASANNKAHVKKKRTYRRESDEMEEYLIRLQEFEPRYSFHLQQQPRSNECYSQYSHSIVRGQLISPKIIDVTQVEIILMADRSLDRESIARTERYSPIAIGNIELAKDILKVFLSIPFQAFSMLAPSLIAGKIEVLSISGKKLKYRQALITSMRLEGKYRPEEYL